MAGGRTGNRHDIEIGGIIGFESRHLHQRVAVHLVEVAAHLLRNGERAPLLDPFDDFQKIGTPEFVDRALPQKR